MNLKLECNICFEEDHPILAPCRVCKIRMCIECIEKMEIEYVFICPQCGKVQDNHPDNNHGGRRYFPMSIPFVLPLDNPLPATTFDKESIYQWLSQRSYSMVKS